MSLKSLKTVNWYKLFNKLTEQHLRLWDSAPEPVIDGMRLSRSLLSLPQCRPLFGPLQVFLIRWSPGCGIINSAMKAQVDTRILKISPQRKYIYFQCCKVLSYMSLSMAPHACQLSLSLESFSAECSWCGQRGNVSFPWRWVGDVIVRDCRRCVICGYWGIRLFSHSAPRRLRSSQFMFLANIKQSPTLVLEFYSPQALW